MYSIDQILDLAKQRNGISSDRKLALKLEVTSVHLYRSGQNMPSDETSLRLAELAGLPPQVVIATVHIAKEPDSKVRQLYKEWMDQAMAAGLAFVFALGMLSSPAPAAASTGSQAASSPGEYILCQTDDAQSVYVVLLRIAITLLAAALMAALGL